MLSRAEIKALQKHRSYPAVSILAPTHRTAPSNKQDPIRIKNLVRKAVDRLHGEFQKREVAGVVKNLQELVRNVDWQHLLDGLALFASQDQSVAVNLPFRVSPRAMVDETFATRDLVYAYNRAQPYRVLLLSHAPKLYEAWADVLELHSAKPFPMKHIGPGGASKLPGGVGVNRSAVRDEAMRTFFRSVDAAVGDLQKANRLPIIAVGTDRNLAFYREVTKDAASIAGMLTGNHDQTEASKLGRLVWPVFDVSATKDRTEALVQLDSAVSANRHASGIDQVWRAAGGRGCKTLLVEKQFKYPADVSPDGSRLLPFTKKGPQALDDAVDEIIEKVMEKDGAVYFYETGDLDGHQRIAAVLNR